MFFLFMVSVGGRERFNGIGWSARLLRMFRENLIEMAPWWWWLRSVMLEKKSSVTKPSIDLQSNQLNCAHGFVCEMETFITSTSHMWLGEVATKSPSRDYNQQTNNQRREIMLQLETELRSMATKIEHRLCAFELSENNDDDQCRKIFSICR